MGNTRRIRKAMKGICMAKTGITFEGCQVALAIDNPAEAEEKARRFRVMMNKMNYRSSFVNIRDIVAVSLIFREKIMNGEALWN